MLKKIPVKTSKRTELIDVTDLVRKAVDESKIKNGICYLFVPHTTSAITINENADPDVTKDILHEINKAIPFDDNYSHSEGNSAAHIKASIFGFSEIILIEDGQLVLGTWQGIYFCEFDGGRNRTLVVKIVEG